MGCPLDHKLFLGPELPGTGGARVSVRHTDDHQVEVAMARIAKEGEDLTGSRVFFGHPVGNVVHIVDELDLRGGQPATTLNTGPAQVATDEYRNGWDRIFGECPVGQA